MTSTLTSKGQVTIPKSLREQLGLEAGDRLEFLAQPDGTIRVIPLTGSLQALKGFLPKPNISLTIAAMDEAVGTAILDQLPRSDRD